MIYGRFAVGALQIPGELVAKPVLTEICLDRLCFKWSFEKGGELYVKQKLIRVSL